jgi:hypothetical protein
MSLSAESDAVNIDFRVKEVGAEVYEVSLRIETLTGLRNLLDFLVAQMPRKRTLDYVSIVGNGVDALERRDPEAFKSAADVAALLTAAAGKREDRGPDPQRENR